MVDVRDREAYDAWLREQPQDVVVALAARNALRSIPLLNGWISSGAKQEEIEFIALSSFHAVATAILSGIWKSQTSKAAIIAANGSFNATTTANDLANRLLISPRAVGFDRHNAAIRALAALSATRQSISEVSEAHTVVGRFTIADEFAQNYDIELILAGTTAEKIISSTLWPQTEGLTSFPGGLQREWAQLKSYLLEQDSNWSVWTDWYDALLEGNAPFIEEIEIGDPENGRYGRVTFPPDYYQDPPRLNAALKQVIDDYWASREAQDPTAEVFDITEDGQIDVVTKNVGTGLLDTPQQRDWYEALRDSVEIALEAGQQLGPAKTPLDKLMDALPEDLGQARIARLWPRANKVRRLLAKHQNVAGEDYDPDRLESAVAIELEGIVGAYNNLRISDPNLIAADENARSPAEVSELIEQNDAFKPLLADAIEQDILTLDAADILVEATETLSEVGLQNEIMGRLAAEPSAKTQRNFLRKVVSIARDGGAIYGAIKGVKEIIDLIGRHKELIRELLGWIIPGL